MTTARTSSDLLKAAIAAETTPGMFVSCVKGRRYRLNEPLYWRGVDTVLDLNGAIIESDHSYDGKPNPRTGEQSPGAAIYVTPRFGEPEPWSASKVDGFLWLNVAGGASALDPAGAGVYQEEAPIQYPGIAYGTYTAARRIITPCQNVTIKNGTIKRISGDIPLLVFRANGVLIENVTADKSYAKRNLSIEGATGVLVRNVDFGGLQFNSSTGCRATQCSKLASVAWEEANRDCGIDHCTGLDHAMLNDPTSHDSYIMACEFASAQPYGGVSLNVVGCQRMLIAGNTFAAFIGAGAEAKGLAVVGNKGLGMNGRPGVLIESENSWQR